jgi:hypothetical protein
MKRHRQESSPPTQAEKNQSQVEALEDILFFCRPLRHKIPRENPLLRGLQEEHNYLSIIHVHFTKLIKISFPFPLMITVNKH